MQWLGYKWPAKWIDDSKLKSPPPKTDAVADLPQTPPSKKASKPSKPMAVKPDADSSSTRAFSLSELERRWFGFAKTGAAAARLLALETVVLGEEGTGGLQARLHAVKNALADGI